MDNSYGELKAEALKNLEAVKSVAVRRQESRLVAYLDETAQKFSADRFSLVVLGEFKRGKTTFINALLGAELLPTSVVPLTSIVTLIQYGGATRADVDFLSGDTKKIALEDVPGYVTEEGNPGNEKKVKLVRLEHPSPYLKDGVILIDTPGVGSIYQNNTDVTYNYLPMVDAAIFLLSSDQPISRSELTFLKDTVQYSAKTFFILNKVDYLTDGDREKALAFSRKVLDEKAGFPGVNIHPLSARLALEGRLSGDRFKLQESGLPAFTAVLESFLLSEKGRAAISAACNKGKNSAGELQLGLELEMKALEIPMEDLKAKIALFDRMVEELRQEQEDNSYIFQGEMDKVYHELEREITRFQESRNDLLLKEVEKVFLEKKQLTGRNLLRCLESYIEERVRTAFEEWQPVVEVKVREAFDRVVGRFTGRTNRVTGELLRQSAEIFDLKVRGFTEMEALSGETRLYYVFGEQQTMLAPDTVKLYALLLPKFISGPAIIREMKKKVERELDRNCGRLRTDYNERIIRSARDFKRAYEDKFNSAIEGARLVLERAIEKRERSGKEAAEARRELAGQVKILEAARKGLEK